MMAAQSQSVPHSAENLAGLTLKALQSEYMMVHETKRELTMAEVMAAQIQLE